MISSILSIVTKRKIKVTVDYILLECLNLTSIRSRVGTMLKTNAALLKNFGSCAQIMLTDIEQCLGIHSSFPMYCLQISTFIGNYYVSEAQKSCL